MKPCDCKNKADKLKLREVGVKYSDYSMKLEGDYVVLKSDRYDEKITVPMNRFKIFAEWYLEDQDEEGYKKFLDELRGICDKY